MRAQRYTDVDLTGPLALVVGAEAEGLGDAWSAPDVTAVHLPMLGIADSLNVSVSAAILFYEARRQRGEPATHDQGVTVDSVRFRDHRRRTGRRGRRVQGARARRVGRHRRSRVVRRQLPAHRLPAVEVAARRRGAAPRQPGRVRLGRGLEGARLTWSTGPGRGGARRLEPLRPRWSRPARSPTAGPARSTVVGGSWCGTTRAAHELAATNVMVAVGSVSKRPPVEGIDDDPDLDEPRRDPGPRAAGQPARPWRWSDRLRAGPGLRPLRRADHDRPVRTPAGADRSSAQLRGHARDARAGRRGRADRRPGAAGTGRQRSRRRARDRARRRHRRPRATPSCWPSVGLPDRRPRARALRHRHDRPDPVPARRPAADRRRPVGDRRPGRSGAAHPPGPLPGRARGPDGARRSRSCPTTGRCPGRPTRIRRRRRSG